MPEAMRYADARAQVRERALVIDDTCTEEELTVLCRLMFWVLTASIWKAAAILVEDIINKLYLAVKRYPILQCWRNPASSIVNRFSPSNGFLTQHAKKPSKTT